MKECTKSVEMLLDAMSKGFITLESGQDKYKICVEFRNSDDAWDAYQALLRMTTTKGALK